MIAAVVLVLQAMIAVPDAVRQELDTMCAGWQLAPVLPEIAEEIKTRTPTWPPNLLPGDFNGDGAIDVAVLQECRGTVQLVAFLSRDRGFSKEVLEKPEPIDPRAIPSPGREGIRPRRDRRRVRSDRRTRVGVPRWQVAIDAALDELPRLQLRGASGI